MKSFRWEIIRVTYRVRLRDYGLNARVGTAAAAECDDVRLPGVRSAEQKNTMDEEEDGRTIIPVSEGGGLSTVGDILMCIKN